MWFWMMYRIRQVARPVSIILPTVSLYNHHLIPTYREESRADWNREDFPVLLVRCLSTASAELHTDSYRAGDIRGTATTVTDTETTETLTPNTTRGRAERSGQDNNGLFVSHQLPYSQARLHIWTNIPKVFSFARLDSVR